MGLREPLITRHIYNMQFAGGSEALEMQSKEGIEELLSHVTRVLDTLTNSRTQHLFLINNSPR